MPKPLLLRSKSHFPDSEAPLSISRQLNQRPMQAHAHEFVEIVLILSGTGLHSSGNVRHAISGGDVLVIHGKRSHAYEETKNLHLVNVLIREPVLEEASKKLGSLPGYHPLFTFETARWRAGDFSNRLRLSPADLKKASSWIDAMEDESSRHNTGGYFLALSWLMLLLGLLAGSYGKDTLTSAHLDMRLGRILTAMDRDPAQPMHLENLAREAQMSQRSFLRYFQEATGCSPVHYLIRSRVRKAEEMLVQDGGLSITEIAFRCGFNDSNYFSRQFRRLTGKTPRSCRS